VVSGRECQIPIIVCVQSIFALRDVAALTLPKPDTYTRSVASHQMPKANRNIITVGITGASGAIYAQTVLRLLDSDQRVEHVFLVVSEAGARLLATELNVVATDAKKLPALLTGTTAKKFEYLANKDIGASVASGSSRVDGMVIIPCSAGALGSIAAGTAADLLTRAADVCLKERSKLVLCLRETPLNRIHLENALRVHDAGAIVMPAMPAFYYGPQTIADLVEQYAFRVLAQLGLPQDKQYRWNGGVSKNRIKSET
jgi:flavin prenyltransferase